MSTRYKNGSHYENHPKAAELHDGAAHAHRVAEQQGKPEHLTGGEQSRLALEHSHIAYERTAQMHQTGLTEHAVTSFGHADIAALAHELWVGRGCPQGSPDEDWFRAAEELRSRFAVR